MRHPPASATQHNFEDDRQQRATKIKLIPLHFQFEIVKQVVGMFYILETRKICTINGEHSISNSNVVLVVSRRNIDDVVMTIFSQLDFKSRLLFGFSLDVDGEHRLLVIVIVIVVAAAAAAHGTVRKTRGLLAQVFTEAKRIKESSRSFTIQPKRMLVLLITDSLVGCVVMGDNAGYYFEFVMSSVRHRVSLRITRIRHDALIKVFTS
jgi:hypothetical protein